MGRSFELFSASKPKNKPYFVIRKLAYSADGVIGGENVNFNSLMHVIIPNKGEPFRIGRRSDNNLIFSDLTVSRTHAEIVFQEGTFQIFDKYSRYGTLVSFRSPISIQKET